MRPTRRWPDNAELVREFAQARQRSIEFAMSSDMVFQDLDCYQWLVFLAAHGERHARQIEEIRTEAGFKPNAASA